MIPFILQPGDPKSVTLVSIGGRRCIRGGNNIADGPVEDANIKTIMETIHARGFAHLEEENSRSLTSAYCICV